MDISDLSREQQVALVALLEAVAVSDGGVTEEEEVEIGRVAEALGPETYRARLDEAERRFSDPRKLRAFLAAIQDPAAREVIYGAALEEALAEPSVSHAKSELMEWLARTWSIEPELQPDAGEEKEGTG